jgi:hypothetical protein
MRPGCPGRRPGEGRHLAGDRSPRSRRMGRREQTAAAMISRPSAARPPRSARFRRTRATPRGGDSGQSVAATRSASTATRQEPERLRVADPAAAGRARDARRRRRGRSLPGSRRRERAAESKFQTPISMAVAGAPDADRGVAGENQARSSRVSCGGGGRRGGWVRLGRFALGVPPVRRDGRPRQGEAETATQSSPPRRAITACPSKSHPIGCGYRRAPRWAEPDLRVDTCRGGRYAGPPFGFREVRWPLTSRRSSAPVRRCGAALATGTFAAAAHGGQQARAALSSGGEPRSLRSSRPRACCARGEPRRDPHSAPAGRSRACQERNRV